MRQTKIKSFTLSEMLVVMIITAVVVGIAFTVLSLVQKQIRKIQENYRKTTELTLLEERLYWDFYSHNSVTSTDNSITFISEVDTVNYKFDSNYIVRDMDSIRAQVSVLKLYLEGTEVAGDRIDAILLSAEKEIPDYSIFVSGQKDATYDMNHGF